MTNPQQFLIYQSEDDATRIDVMLEAETLWLNRKQLTPQVTQQVTQLDSARRTPEPDTEIPHHPEGAAAHRAQEELAGNRLKLHSPGITQANSRKLAEPFPNCVTQGRD